jgi:uncharacterized protein (TIGR01777 family)
MRYLITGGSGFIGTALCANLIKDRQDVTVLTRNIERARRRLPATVTLIDHLSEARTIDAIVNLAGEGLADERWTPARKQLLRDSRLATTRALLDWIPTQTERPRVLISGSAIGWYGAQGDAMLDENAAPASDFAAQLCRDWEAEAIKAEALGLRVCRIRIGVVLDQSGGALAKMLLPFRLGLGGPMGDGRQWMSWIARPDLVALIRWLIDTPAASGAYNATAPAPVINAEFAAALGHALHRPAMLRTPAFVLRLLFGEMAELLLTGQRVLPKRALAEGYTFSAADLPAAFAAVVS